ncbi:FUSC family protein [Nocardioides sp.]|uniref:FUSC family protein n=1 Tax=Nocardioides sp. TaxID=35761 RepID=UPI0026336722|nr:FUSC family protein [Nocardioides sp.]
MSRSFGDLPPTTQRLLNVGPHNGAHRIAGRAMVSIAVPLLTLWATDHISWTIYAAFGAFTSLYGRTTVGRARLQLQVSSGALITASVLIGVLVGMSPARTWLAIPIVAAIAAVGAAISTAQRQHPPGPLFLVFASAACATIPSTPSDLVPAFAVSAGAVAVSVVVGSAGWWLRSLRGWSDPTRFEAWDFSSIPYRHVVRCGLACLIAGTLATAVGIGHPYWAMVSAVVPLVVPDIGVQLERGILRIVGTVGGVLVAAFLLDLGLPTLGLVCCIIATQTIGELLVGRNYALGLLAITPTALLMVSLAHPSPIHELVVDRTVETIIGVAVGVATGRLAVRRG